MSYGKVENASVTLVSDIEFKTNVHERIFAVISEDKGIIRKRSLDRAAFCKKIKTGTDGAERETWLLEYEGSQFIFVPGRKNVTLGWDTGRCPLGDGVLEGLLKEFSSGHEYYYEEEMENLKGDYQERIDEAEENGDSVKGMTCAAPTVRFC